MKRLAAAAAAALAITAAGHAAREKPPGWWLAQAACIRAHEALHAGSWRANTGNGYYGAYQFVLSTWQAVGGHGYPHLASPAEQTYRAWLNWRANGSRWGGSQWPASARACGLR